MAATVQAACPGCRSILRIPADWTDRALRCKKCGAVVRAKKKAADGTAQTPAATPATDTATAPAVGQTAPTTPPQPGPPAPYAVPPGYAYPVPLNGSPYAVPPGYAYPAPGYPPQAAYPYPAPPAAEPTDLLVPPDESFSPPSPARRKYKPRRTGGRLLGVFVVLLVCGAMAGGGALLYNKYVGPQLPQRVATTRPDKNGVGGVTETTGKSPPALIGDPFPRRLLFIHVSNYIYFNNLSPGSEGGKDVPTESAVKMAVELRVPTDKENDQLFLLCDTAKGKAFHPPVRPVIQGSYSQFFQTSRKQDRVVVYFGGHAVVADGKAFLVPVEGEPDNPATLIPLDDFYAKLKECNAQQKIVLFDVCRLDLNRGEEKPGGERMSEELAKVLLAAPPGVQVALSCGPGQNAQESGDKGSEFLRAFRVMAERTRTAMKSAAPVAPGNPIPAAQWIDGIRAYLADQRGRTPPQSVKTAGTEPTTQVEYSKDEPPAQRFDWPALPKGVPADEVAKILQQVSLPGIRADLSVPADLPRVYPFAEEVMKNYKSDGVTDEQILKDGGKYPVRKAALEALRKINEVWKSGTDGKVGIMEEFEGDVDDKLKKSIQDQQVVPAKIILTLEEVLADLEAAAKGLDKEKSKRWRAIFEYAQAQALLRWTFMQEYDAALGKIRTDNLPRDPGGARTGLRLVSTPKTNPKHKEKMEAANELLDKMAEEHKGTPYEVIAKLHRHISVGLEWRSLTKDKKDDAK